MKNSSLIVYYSWIGSTEVVAKEIQRITEFDIQRIEDKKQRKLGNIAGAAMGAFFGLRGVIMPMDFALKEYEHLFLGTPVWAGKTPPAINSYLKKTSFKNKKVWLFITKGDEKVPQQVIDSITKRIEKKGGKVMGSISITTKWDPKTNIPIALEDVQKPIYDWLKRGGIL